MDRIMENLSLSFLLSESPAIYSCKFCSQSFVNTTQLLSHKNESHIEQLTSQQRPQFSINNNELGGGNKRKRVNLASSSSHKNYSTLTKVHVPFDDNEEDSEMCDTYDYNEEEEVEENISNTNRVKEERMEDDQQEVDIQLESFVECGMCGNKFLSSQNLESHLSLECPINLGRMRDESRRQQQQQQQFGGVPTSSKPLKKRIKIENDYKVEENVDHQIEDKLVAVQEAAAMAKDMCNQISPMTTTATTATTITSAGTEGNKYRHILPKQTTTASTSSSSSSSNSPISILTIDPTKIPAPLMYRLLPKNFSDSLIESLF